MKFLLFIYSLICFNFLFMFKKNHKDQVLEYIDTVFFANLVFTILSQMGAVPEDRPIDENIKYLDFITI